MPRRQRRQNVAEGEFAGVELSFMGLNNQNLHNVLFRGFLKPWEAYTGAKITWIDLAQADYNPRLQQSIATGTVDFDIIEMGAPFEGDVCGKGLASEMPDWVKQQIEMDDYVGYLQAPVGTWNGKTYRIIDRRRLPHLQLSHGRVLRSRSRRPPGRRKAARANGAADAPGRRCKRCTKFLKGKKIDRPGRVRLPRPAKGWGGFGFYFLESRASAYAKHPDDKAWLFDPDTMKPRVNNPALVRAIQDVIDSAPRRAGRSDQRRPQHDGLPAVPRRHRARCCPGGATSARWRGPTTARSSATSSVSISCPGSDDVYNLKTGAVGRSCRAVRTSRRTWPISAGASTSQPRVDSDEKKKKAAWSAAAHLGGKDISLWMAAYPSGFQPYRNSHFDIAEWVEAGYDEAYITSYLDSNKNSYNHPNAAIEPRIPGIFQYYSVARTSLRRPSPARTTRRRAPTRSPRPGRS